VILRPLYYSSDFHSCCWSSWNSFAQSRPTWQSTVLPAAKLFFVNNIEILNVSQNVSCSRKSMRDFYDLLREWAKTATGSAGYVT
jgi:hypothetical protein